MRQDTEKNSRLSASLEAYARARARREASEEIEAKVLKMVYVDAREEKKSLREIEAMTGVPRATLARKALADAFGKNLFDTAHCNEDEWVAALDAAWGEHDENRMDRGPFYTVRNDDGSLSVVLLPYDDPPALGISDAEAEFLQEQGMDGQRAEWIIRRLARAVLRRLHPGFPRAGEVLDAAVEGVREDVLGAMMLAECLRPDVTLDADHRAEVRTRRQRGYYLPTYFRPNRE